MTINRPLLGWGVFFIAAGGTLLAVEAGLVPAAALRAALGLWPVLLIAIGITIILRGTRLALAGGVAVAATAGLLLGSAIAIVPRLWFVDYRAMPDVIERLLPIDRRHPIEVRPPFEVRRHIESHAGAFAGPAAIDLDLAWGDLVVATAPGPAWRLDIVTGDRVRAQVEADPRRLAVRSPGDGWPGIGAGESWRLWLPTGQRLDLNAQIDAARAQFYLDGATLGDVALAVDAGNASVDLTTATADDVTLRVNGGAAALLLPASDDVAAAIEVNAGSARICAPDGVGLRVWTTTALASINAPGLVRVGDVLESPHYATAAHRADVTVEVNVGSVEINPEGGCR
jgi:hypothetical protein